MDFLYHAERDSFSQDLRQATPEQVESFIANYSEPTGHGRLTKEEYIDRCMYLLSRCSLLENDSIFWHVF